MKNITVKELKESLKDVPDDLEVILNSDTGVDQGCGEIIIEIARRVQCRDADYFSIYANDVEVGGDECKMWTLRNPDEAEEIVSTWAKEHPVRTYLIDFKEKFPKSTYSDSEICCNVCRGCLYGQKKSLDECLCGDCEECWNQEVKKK